MPSRASSSRSPTPDSISNFGVLIAPVETPAGPWERADAAVVADAPGLTWFVRSFAEVCDRDAVSGGGLNQGIVVPPGFPHSRCG